MTLKVKFYYTISNNGDGSASVQFYPDQESAQLACDIEDETGEPFCENWPNAITLEFNEAGVLLNPTMTKIQLLKELAERRGEEFDGDSYQDQSDSGPSPTP